jgi:hypothetical protein
MKKGTLLISLLAALPLAVLAAPRFGEIVNRNVGVVASYVARSGTNTTIQVLYDRQSAFRLAEVTATVNGSSTSVNVHRVWAYTGRRTETKVETSFFGSTVTNVYDAGTEVIQTTNLLYNSATGTLPSSGYVLPGEALHLDFGDQTNVLVRIVGTAN